MLTPHISRPEIATLGGAYFAFFAIVGLMVPYLSVYLDLLGYDSQSIGYALAMIALMRAIAPTLWSALADKTGQHIFIARCGAFLAVVSLALLFWVESREARLVVLAAFNFFWTAILPQVEVISLRKLAAQEGLYARVRSAGSIGFITIATLTGLLIEQHGPQTFIVIGVLLALSLWVSLLVIKAPAKAMQQAQQKCGSAAFLSLPLMGLILCCFLIQTSHGAYYTFFILHMTELGYSSFTAGWLAGVGVVAEVVLFWFIGAWFKRMAVLRIFQIAIAITVLRWLLMAEYADVWPLLLVSLLMHAASFGMVHSCAMRWLHDRVPHAHQAKAQALYAGLGFGAGSAAGAAVVGPLWQGGQGASLSYLVCAGIAGGAMAVFWLTLRKEPDIAKS